MIVTGWHHKGLLRCCVSTLRAMVDDAVEVEGGQLLRCAHCKTALVVGPRGVVGWVRESDLQPGSAA